MRPFDIHDDAHRRLNILTGEWVQVSPHRSKRPWSGQTEKNEIISKPEYDESCYLCPGNKRANGDVNPQYNGTFSFSNDFAAIPPDTPKGQFIDGLLQAKSEQGTCKVVCFSPRHDLTVPEMELDQIIPVIDLWIDECETLGALEHINYVQVFENKGEIMGCSNAHPHGQIWAQETIPVEPSKKQERQLGYFKIHGRSMLDDYLEQELVKDERIIFENDHFVALVPFWAVWPYEAMLLPKRRMSRITEMSHEEIESFAAAYHRLTIKYDNLFEISFPYSAGIHQAPFDNEIHEEWHWHMVFYPPLLRSATVKKFMVGYEMLANPQRDITPEFGAQKLKSMPEVHYKRLVEQNL
ncbi:UDP-glucose--hexose-1-phosphate uridylyltransferase [Fulvivirgaceae bacterium BMA10]|uniref:Galactose-1-phosphate uridylyltransferase n=1 Tax=Splendidivirga corallicola TaxID=3051826 RepID=A0ABT8KHW4_9BACT|nr:UDP-glucose--hexose-1-phosphate uridylyltransferase [Fulvivirgaceae bacterium BMA10]